MYITFFLIRPPPCRYSSQTTYRIKIDRIQQALVLVVFCKDSTFLHDKHTQGGGFYPMVFINKVITPQNKSALI